MSGPGRWKGHQLEDKSINIAEQNCFKKQWITKHDFDPQLVCGGVEGPARQLQADPERVSPSHHQGSGGAEVLRPVPVQVLRLLQVDMLNV